ncbi:MAG: hypothetical protein VX468_03680 [Pseudomonadota bacterium]|nr:hypothetical protein [Pseudomonadota bacterium]
MGNFLRQCALDFSRSTCRDGLLPFHEKALRESNDFVARIRLMCERQSRDCTVLSNLFTSTDRYEYFTHTVSFKELAELFLTYDDVWMNEAAPETANDNQDAYRVKNAQHYQHIAYLKRCAENYLENFEKLGAVQQMAMSYITDPYVAYTVNNVNHAASGISLKKIGDAFKEMGMKP